MKIRKTLEAHNLHDTEWGKRIITANENNVGFTQQDIEDAKDWLKSPVTDITAGRIPTFTEQGDDCNAPINKHMYTLGLYFAIAVERNHYGCATHAIIDIYKTRTKIIGGLL